MGRYEHVAKQAEPKRPFVSEFVDPAAVVTTCERCGAGYANPVPPTCVHPGCVRMGKPVDLHPTLFEWRT